MVILFSTNVNSEGTNIFGLGIYDLKFDGSSTKISDTSLEAMKHYLILDQKKIISSS